MRQLIVFLIRKKLGVRKLQEFQFVGQSSKTDTYYFTSSHLWKIEHGHVRESGVSLSWLLNEHCEIKKLQGRV